MNFVVAAREVAMRRKKSAELYISDRAPFRSNEVCPRSPGRCMESASELNAARVADPCHKKGAGASGHAMTSGRDRRAALGQSAEPTHRYEHSSSGMPAR